MDFTKEFKEIGRGQNQTHVGRLQTDMWVNSVLCFNFGFGHPNWIEGAQRFPGKPATWTVNHIFMTCIQTNILRKHPFTNALHTNAVNCMIMKHTSLKRYWNMLWKHPFTNPLGTKGILLNRNNIISQHWVNNPKTSNYCDMNRLPFHPQGWRRWIYLPVLKEKWLLY